MKMPWRLFAKKLWRCFKTYSKRLSDVLKMSLRSFSKSSWRRLEDILARCLKNNLKASWRCVSKTNIFVLIKTSWRLLEDVFWRGRRKTSSNCLQDVFMRTNLLGSKGSIEMIVKDLTFTPSSCKLNHEN